MDASQAALLLSQAAAYDNRTVNESAARAWAEALHDVPYADAREAVVAHYRESRQWMMPADVHDRVKAVQRDRVLAGMHVLRSAEIEAPEMDKYIEWERAVRAELRAGATALDADRAACEHIGHKRPAAEVVENMRKVAQVHPWAGPGIPDQISW